MQADRSATPSKSILKAAAATGSPQDWDGGSGTFAVFGAWNGATAALEFSPDAGTTWIAVDESGDTHVTKTADGAGQFTLPKCKIRVAISGAGGSTSLSATVAGV